jgi:hypothetical protein
MASWTHKRPIFGPSLVDLCYSSLMKLILSFTVLLWKSCCTSFSGLLRARSLAAHLVDPNVRWNGHTWTAW